MTRGPAWTTGCSLRLTRAATYYIVATTDYAEVGDYRLSISDITPTEPDIPADTTTQAVLEVDGDRIESFALDTWDHDWFAVTMSAGNAYRVTARGVPPFDSVGIAGIRYGDDPYIQTGTNIDTGTQDNPNRLVFTPTRTGVYYIDIGNSRCCSAYSWVGPYNIEVDLVETITSANFSDVAAKATEATLGEEYSSRAPDPPNNSGAWFSVHLDEGKTYETLIERPATQRFSGYLLPYRRGIYDSNGTIIPDSNRGDFTPPQTGAYYIRVGRNILYYDRRGFSIEIREAEPPPPPPPSPDEALFESRSDDDTATLTVDETADGSIDDPDTENDWYEVEVEGGDGQTYWVELSGLGVRNYTLGVPWIRAVFDADGGVEYTDDDADSRADGFELRPSEDTTYYIVVRGMEDLHSGTDGTGSYGILVSDTSPPGEDDEDLSADITTSGRAKVNGSVSGVLEEHGDRDWYKIELQGGVSYQVDMRGPWTGQWTEDGFVTPGTLHNPKLLGVYDSGGILVDGSNSEVDSDGLDSRIVSFTPAADGDYYIAAGAEADAGTGTYQLSVGIVQ